MKRFNVSRRLIGLLLAFGLTTVLAVAALALLLHHAIESSAAVTKRAAEQENRSYALLGLIADTHGDVQRFLRLKDPDEMEKALKELTDQQQQVRAELSAAGAEFAGLQTKFEALAVEEKAAVEEALRGNTADAFQQFLGPTAKQYEVVLAELEQQHKGIARATEASVGAYRASAERSLYWQSGLLAALLALVLGFGWRLKNRIVRELQGVCTVVATASAELSDTVGQVSASSHSLADGASEQAASLEETSSSLEQIAATTKCNAENSQKANDLAKAARGAAERGMTDMQDMSAAIAAIKVSSDDIAKIIKTIDEIAFQTNILALNAAVEAARAGAAGMGFAVVADEVRNLAQRSAHAAKETSAKIENAIGRIGQGVELSTKVAKTLEEIVAKARQVDQLAAEVATGSREQSQGITQINAAVSQLGSVTQSNAAHAEESATAAEHLNTQAQAMKEAVAQLGRLLNAAGQQDSLAPQPAALKPAASKNGHSLPFPEAGHPKSGNGKLDDAFASLVETPQPSPRPARLKAVIPMDGDRRH